MVDVEGGVGHAPGELFVPGEGEFEGGFLERFGPSPDDAAAGGLGRPPGAAGGGGSVSVVGGDSEGGEFGVEGFPFAADAVVGGALDVPDAGADALGAGPEGREVGAHWAAPARWVVYPAAV